MFGIDLLAVVAASVAALVANLGWYIASARQWRKLNSARPGAIDDNRSRPEPVKMLGETVRNIVLALVIACLLFHGGVVNRAGALQMGLLLWIGLPVTLPTGSIVRENYPRQLAAIHAGDWLVKLVLLSVIVGLRHSQTWRGVR